MSIAYRGVHRNWPIYISERFSRSVILEPPAAVLGWAFRRLTLAQPDIHKYQNITIHQRRRLLELRNGVPNVMA
ncbi:MAG: hypothetical protein WAK66_08495, partial [Methylocystis sp.]